MSSVVEMKGIHKSFPNVHANKGIDFDLKKGEIHALIGENGAGKSTLMNILCGLYQPDSGQIWVNGRSVILDPAGSIAEGIGMVHQHFMLIPGFTVTENIILGQEKTFFLDRSSCLERIKHITREYGLFLNPDIMISELSVGEAQRVEILKALYRGAEILILDEPTSMLSPSEIKQFFSTLKNLRSSGRAIVLITHKLEEVLEIADRVTVLRKGEKIGETPAASANREGLASMMIGRALSEQISKKRSRPGRVVLEVENLSAASVVRPQALKNISFQIKEGEILGIGGVEGNGQTELTEVLAGLRSVSGGSIHFKDKDVTNISARERYEMGMAHIPEDRLRYGLVEEYSLQENAILGQQFRRPYSGAWGLNYRWIRSLTERIVDQYEIQPPVVCSSAHMLSGGNQQRFVIGRELTKNPLLMIASQVARGVDVGAVEFIHRKIINARDDGMAVLLISYDLDEVVSLSDRLIIMYRGEIIGELSPKNIDYQEISLLMAGIKS